MNGEFYQNPIFPNEGLINNNIPTNQNGTNFTSFNTQEQSYIENILNKNKGKKATFYISIPNSKEIDNKPFTGIIEQIGKDHIIISNPNGKWYLLPLMYLTYITFDETINYS